MMSLLLTFVPVLDLNPKCDLALEALTHAAAAPLNPLRKIWCHLLISWFYSHLRGSIKQYTHAQHSRLNLSVHLCVCSLKPRSGCQPRTPSDTRTFGASGIRSKPWQTVSTNAAVGRTFSLQTLSHRPSVVLSCIHLLRKRHPAPERSGEEVLHVPRVG